MAVYRREGLRVRLREPPEPGEKGKQSNSKRCKEYRERLKSDPAKYEKYKEKYKERNRRNRSKVLTDEERQRRQELNRQRQQKYRDRHKATYRALDLTSEATMSSVQTRRTKQNNQAAVEARRAKWREDKRRERANWSGQKQRRNRERALEWYYKKKKLQTVESEERGTTVGDTAVQPTDDDTVPPATVDNPTPQPAEDNTIRTPGDGNTVPPATVDNPTPQPAEDNTIGATGDGDTVPKTPRATTTTTTTTTKEGERKAVYRVKKALSKLKPSAFQKLFNFMIKKGGLQVPKSGSPSAKAIKKNVLGELERLKTKRSKESLTARKLLFDTVEGGGAYSKSTGEQTTMYQREKKSQAIVELENFLDDVSIDLPGKKTVDKKTMSQKKILPKSVKHLNKEFCNKNPSNTVSRATFYRHIPKHILTSTKHKHQSCLCEICVGIDQKLGVLNKHLNTPFEGRDTLSELSMCLDFTLDCLHRKCHNCGVSQVEELIYNQLSDSDLALSVKWVQWEPVVREKAKTKRPEPVERITSLRELCERLLKDLSSFSLHLFTFRWQYAQFKSCKASIASRNTLGLAVLDFAENFTCRVQDEVQSAYYGCTQVTVHPSVTYYPCQEPGCTQLVTEYVVFLSDDTTHDAAMAQAILDRTVQHMLSRFPTLKQLTVFSDGCAAQYKSKLPFFTCLTWIVL